MRTAVHLLAACALAGTASVALPLSPAQAQRVTALTGETLVKLCTSRNRTELEECTAYLSGVGDSIDFYQDLLPPDGSKGGRLPAYVCIPNTAKGADLRTAVLNWIRSHPDEARRTAQFIVPRAFHDSFRCR